MSPAWHGMRRGSVFGICLGDRYLRIFVLFRAGGVGGGVEKHER